MKIDRKLLKKQIKTVSNLIRRLENEGKSGQADDLVGILQIVEEFENKRKGLLVINITIV